MTVLLSILWRPFFPPLPIALAAALLAGLAVYAFARSWRVAPATSVVALGMRLALIGALATLLMGPSIVPESQESPTRPTLAVLVDTSASMQTADVMGRPRFEFAAEEWLSESRLRALREHADVRLMRFDESSRAMSDAALRAQAGEVATGGVTNVFGSLGATIGSLANDAALREPGSAVLMLSDGRDTFGAEAAAGFATAGSLPVHTVALGGPSTRRDVAVVAVPLQEYLLAGEEGQIAVRVVHTGADGHATTLRFRTPEGETTQTVELDPSRAARVTLPVKRDEPGLYEFEVLVDPLEDEAELRNNAQPVFVEVTKQRLRVLLLEGAPYWDTKFLAQSLRKDERIELTQIVQVSPQKQEKLLSRVDLSSEATARNADTRIAPPDTLDAWRRYDVVILGAGMENVLTPDGVRELRRYVADFGGRVVFARGRAVTPGTAVGRLVADELSLLEPVVWGEGVERDRKLETAPAGALHASLALADSVAERRAVLGELPGLALAPRVERAKAGAQVLATLSSAGGLPQPAIATMPVGRGSVFAVLGEGLWKWRLAGRDDARFAAAFDRFWSNTVRWLAMGGDYQPGRELAVRLSQRSVQVGETVAIDLSDRTAGGLADASVMVIDPEGRRHAMSPSPVAGSPDRRRSTFEPKTPGVYRVVADAAGLPAPVEARFNVYELDLERLDCSADPRLLRLISEETGGRALDPYDPESLVNLLRRQRQAMMVPPTPQYVWDQGWVLAGVLLWAGAEWLLRKKGGLL